MGFCSFGSNIWVLVFVFQIANYHVHECVSLDSCDLYQGSWVFDKSLPLYNNNTCPFIRSFINCQRNGRPDADYQKYRWQPTGCNLARFNGKDFLKRFQGKQIMFVGDSLSVDQYQSLSCLLYTAAPNLHYNFTRVNEITTFTIPDYDIRVSMDLNHFLVDIINTPKGRILTLDSIQDGKNWLGMDMLIFNTWHWWTYKKPQQPWDYVKDGNKTFRDIDRIYAFQRGLDTWANWVDANIDTQKTRVFFQGVSPDHYHGADWGQPKANCEGQTAPLFGSKYPGPYPTTPVNVIKTRLSKMLTPLTLLDITGLALLRKDGHPSIYGNSGLKGMDCTHWCLAGVPDTWNEILYNIIISGK